VTSLPPPQLSPPPSDPLYLVESAFLASTAVLVWLLSYSPLGPFVRLFFGIPVALGVMRWDPRTGLLTLVVSGLLLTIILGPTRSVLYVVPYGILGYWCGRLWRQGSSWYLSVLTGAGISTFGLMFQFLLSSLLVGENLWAYLTIQLTGFTNWILDLALSGLGIYVVAQTWMIQISVVGFIALNSVIYVFTVHLVAALVMERLKCPLPLPPKWVQFLLD
jgi:uncharacterized protein YybS (DUF2232 family)